ncbi:SDR family NAD(P)-dependent oxidoreductase [Alkalimonas sp.]|uniref:SDR family NAD(P)-dependent oxidoreductase n=1 Tax=Alkalimonas sp. TaxID=1872453 RepID=UPI00263AA716|nr:SDR family NAD(P)-dependent oxidoreductase [Alkalimonas sp.]MCC5827721.1 SDR family NAD(P)-dependent oxidoreductase [Alkalimonas sp.]
MPYCLITGASSGIGRQLAIHYAKAGWRVLAVARSTDALNALAQQHAGIQPFTADLTQEKDIAALCQAVADSGQPLDLAILNAGTCVYVDATDLKLSDFEQTFAINFFALVALSAALLPLLKQATTGRLALVSSLAHYFPFTRAEAYGASKAAVSYFADSLRADWASEGVAVSLIEPGFVDTPLTQKNDFAMPFLLTVEDATNRIVSGLDKSKPRIRFPKRLVWSLNLLRVLPYRWRIRLAKGMKQ